MTKKETLLWYAYMYDEYYGCILCLQNKVLSYATTNHEGYQKSKSYVCQSPCAEKLHAKSSAREERYPSYLAGLNGDLNSFSIFIYRKKGVLQNTPTKKDEVRNRKRVSKPRLFA